MTALHGTVEHVSGYDPRSVEIGLNDAGHDLEPGDEVAVHAVKHIADDTAETFAEVLGRKLDEVYEIKLIEQLAELEAIVRDLAAEDDVVVDLDPEVMNDYVCMVCPETDDDSPGTVHVRGDFVHAEACAWQRSRAWVDANTPPQSASDEHHP